MYEGPFFPGFHALILTALAVFWIVVVAAVLAALYFVVRTAVTQGTLRADAIREGRPFRPHRPAGVAPEAAAPPAPPAPPAPEIPPAPETPQSPPTEPDPR